MNQLVLILITGALGAFGGVGIWTFLSKWLELRAKREERDEDQLRADHRDCLERVDALEEDLRRTQRRLEVVEAHHGSLFARWIKDAGKRLVYVNGRAMATIFGPLGYTRDQIEGRTFLDLLDIEAAREIDRLDRAALTQPGRAVSSMLQLHPRLPVMIVVKVAGVGRDQELVYEGHAYEVNDAQRVLERAERREEEQVGLSILRLEGPRAGSPAPDTENPTPQA